MNTDGLYAAVISIPVVGVAMGLMFAYLISSLVASTVKEVIASIFQWRGTYLQHGIGVLLSNTPGMVFAWGTFSKWFVAHFTRVDPTATPSPAVTAATAAAGAAATALAATRTAVAAPQAAAAAAITAATDAGAEADTAATNAVNAASAQGLTADARALANIAATAARKAATAAAGRSATAIADAEAALATACAALNVHGIQTHPLLKGTPTGLPSYVPAVDFSTAMLDMLRDGSASPAIVQVKSTVDALPDGDIKRILSAFIQDAAGDLDRLRARIESWFDDAMDRLSGIYKRLTQYVLLVLGLVIAVTLNIDSVHLASALWDQPALRAQIIAQVQAKVPPSNTGAPAGGQKQGDAASKAADPNLEAVKAAIQQVQSLPLPVGRGPCVSVFGEPLPDMPGPAATTSATTKCPKPGKGKYATGVLGWVEWALPGWLTTRQYSSGWHGWNEWTLLGWLITAFAISLGAPFWFGLLQNIMNLRAAGTPPPRADAQTTGS